jgi:hypothetical protein
MRSLFRRPVVAVAAAVGLWVGLLPRLTHACPDCAIGRQARGRFFADQFWLHIAVIALPLLAVVAISVALFQMGRPPR